jgi:hypothetical protein
MSGDHNQNQTDSGWRKRQSALDEKAENARKLGLDYEPDKTIMQMARQAGITHRTDVFYSEFCDGVYDVDLEAFAALIRADEREECAKVADEYANGLERNYSKIMATAIRARGQA